MMHGHEKSDLVIVAVKPTNKARKALRSVAGDPQRSWWSEGRGPRGMRTSKARTGLRARLSVSQALERIRQRVAVTHPRWEPYAGKPHVRIWAGGAR